MADMGNTYRYRLSVLANMKAHIGSLTDTLLIYDRVGFNHTFQQKYSKVSKFQREMEQQVIKY